MNKQEKELQKVRQARSDNKKRDYGLIPKYVWIHHSQEEWFDKAKAKWKKPRA